MANRQTTVEYLTTTKIGEKGQLTVPKEFREKLGLESGSPVAVLRVGDGLVFLPDQQRLGLLCDRISTALTAAGAMPEAILATLTETRARVFARRYGQGSAKKTRRSHERGHSKK
jgi:AbrB family looped-hinge helix DNA binding protein